MTIRVILSDSDTGRSAHVSAEGAQAVYQLAEPLPEQGTPNRVRFFRQYLTLEGTASGTKNMNVNGATTSQEFYIGSSTTHDIHINLIIMVLADTAIVHNNFGNVSPLTNGFDLSVFESGEETFIIQSATTGGEMLAQSGLISPFGDGATVNELSNWTGLDDAQIITIPFDRYIRNGIRIGRGNTDRIIARVNDDLTGLTEFTALAIGYRLYE